MYVKYDKTNTIKIYFLLTKNTIIFNVDYIICNRYSKLPK